MSTPRLAMKRMSSSHGVGVCFGNSEGSSFSSYFVDFGARNRLPSAPVGDELHNAAASRLGQRNDIGDHEDGVSAQVFMDGFDQIDPLLLYVEVHGLRVPA